jgi:hypothetical protein
MDGKEVMIIAVFAIAFGSMMVMTIARAFIRRPRASDSKELQEISARLAHLEQSVDAIAVETERISEGQRFTTRLLSDRAPSEKAER